MSDRERLKDKLGKLAAGQTAAGIDARSEASLMRSIAGLVDETVLPRDLTLAAGGVTVVLTVTRRRLVQVAGDVQASFEEEGAAPLEKLKSDLAGALLGKPAIEIRSARAEIPPDVQGGGASAQALATAWGVDLYAPGAAAAGGLVDWLRGKAYAWISWKDGEPRDEGGDAEYLKLLKKNVSPKDVRAQQGGPRGFVAVGGHSFATAIGIAWDGEDETGFVVARIDLGPLAQAFGGA